MFVARWQFTAQFGKVEDVVAILRKWEIDVGQRAGWKAGALRVTAGLVGAGASDIELEVRVDSLADLEAAWNDMERNPHHREYMTQLGHVIVGGSAHWSVLREVNLIPDEG